MQVHTSAGFVHSLRHPNIYLLCKTVRHSGRKKKCCFWFVNYLTLPYYSTRGHFIYVSQSEENWISKLSWVGLSTCTCIYQRKCMFKKKMLLVSSKSLLERVFSIYLNSPVECKICQIQTGNPQNVATHYYSFSFMYLVTIKSYLNKYSLKYQ